MSLPIYLAKMPKSYNEYDTGGMFACSLVKYPAIEAGFQKFSKQSNPKTFKFSADKEKRIVSGPLMIPDLKIFRRDSDGYEYYVVYERETIEQMRNQFMKNYKNMYNVFNLEHNEIGVYDKVSIAELWIKEFDDDKSNAMGYDLPIGTLFMSAKINDADLWDRIKDDEFSGFSIETYMNYKLENEMNHFYASLSVGETVLTKDENGSIVKFSGQLEEGDVIAVVKDGVIESVTSVEPKVNENEKGPADITAELEAIKTTVEELKVALMSKQNDELAQKISDLALSVKQSFGANTQIKENAPTEMSIGEKIDAMLNNMQKFEQFKIENTKK